MEKYTIKRDGLPPIAFTGEVIASGSNRSVDGNRSNRWTTVTIYRTKGGRYVVTETYTTIWEGESNAYAATSCATAQEVIDWLRERTEGDGLGAVSQEAVERAARVDPAFAKAWIEEVE